MWIKGVINGKQGDKASFWQGLGLDKDPQTWTRLEPHGTGLGTVEKPGFCLSTMAHQSGLWIMFLKWKSNLSMVLTGTAEGYRHLWKYYPLHFCIQ